MSSEPAVGVPIAGGAWHHVYMNQTPSSQTPRYTVPGLEAGTAERINELLDARMISLIDLTLTLKHVHWNVVGHNFIAVHEMLDPQHAAAQAMVDVLAERIATLGGTPTGTPGHVVEGRKWDDYALGRATTVEHLAALDLVYTGVIQDHRSARTEMAELDPITEDLLIGQIAELEHFQWFVRAHLEEPGGQLPTAGASDLRDAAKAAADAQR